MKHFYEHQDDDMRSKLTEHEFGQLPGAWEDMEKRLNKFSSHSGAGNASWSAWFVIGAMLVATTVGILFYQWQSPFGKTNTPVLANENSSEESGINKLTQTLKGKANRAITQEIIPPVSTNTNNTNAHIAATTTTLANPVGTPTHELKPATLAKEPTSDGTKDSQLKEEEEHLEELPGIAPSPELDPNGQRPDNNNSYPTYTRRTEVVRTFSESTLKWKNTALPTINATTASPRRNTLIDTPLIILQTPFDVPQEVLQFGASAGVGTQIYGSTGKFSVAPVVGVFIRKKIDEKYAIQGELHYKMVLPQNFDSPFSKGQVAEMEMTVDIDPSAEVNYQTRNARVYGIRSMHILELPVSFIYELNRRHSVSMGLKVSYLQGVQTANTVINNMSKEALGFSSLDLGALAGYEFAISNHFALGIFYNVGFLNLAKNTKETAAAYNDQFSGSYIMDEDQQQTSLMNGGRILPVQVDADEQIFFEAPRHLYNSDLKVLLRYIF